MGLKWGWSEWHLIKGIIEIGFQLSYPFMSHYLDLNFS